jgi:hypothetical protein
MIPKAIEQRKGKTKRLDLGFNSGRMVGYLDGLLAESW